MTRCFLGSVDTESVAEVVRKMVARVADIPEEAIEIVSPLCPGDPHCLSVVSKKKIAACKLQAARAAVAGFNRGYFCALAGVV